MGARNVAAAFNDWRSHLTNRDMLALVYMANTARDNDTPPVYYGGWEALAHALGQDPDETGKRTALRDLAALAKVGAATSSGNAHKGVRAEYALNFNGHQWTPEGSGRNVTWTTTKDVSQ